MRQPSEVLGKCSRRHKADLKEVCNWQCYLLYTHETALISNTTFSDDWENRVVYGISAPLSQRIWSSKTGSFGRVALILSGNPFTVRGNAKTTRMIQCRTGRTIRAKNLGKWRLEPDLEEAKERKSRLYSPVPPFSLAWASCNMWANCFNSSRLTWTVSPPISIQQGVTVFWLETDTPMPSRVR